MIASPQRLLRGAVAGVLVVVALSGVLRAAWGVDLVAHVHWLPDCAFRALTGWGCPGCGMTRAFLLLGQLRLVESLAAHPLAPGLVAWMVVWWARPGLRVGDRAAAVALCAVMGVWLARAVAGVS